MRPDVGICMDVGHARMMGDVVDAIETCSGHIVTTHLHDNRGRSDDHLVPGEGVIDWDATLLALQKIGYDGVWMFELADTADAGRCWNTAAQGARAASRHCCTSATRCSESDEPYDLETLIDLSHL